MQTSPEGWKEISEDEFDPDFEDSISPSSKYFMSAGGRDCPRLCPRYYYHMEDAITEFINRLRILILINAGKVRMLVTSEGVRASSNVAVRSRCTTSSRGRETEQGPLAQGTRWRPFQTQGTPGARTPACEGISLAAGRWRWVVTRVAGREVDTAWGC